MSASIPASPTYPTVILLRGGRDTLELLMVKRTPSARFMAGYWVFPGGALDAADGEGQAGLRRAAVRELEEEAAVVLAADSELVPFARWITPERLPIRFDTWFYLATAPADAEPRVDGVEIVDFRWRTPGAALAEAGTDALKLAFPTERQLEQLSSFGSAEQALARARALVDQIRPIQPRVVGDGPEARIELP
ncbi:MAG: NUDIX hydrolase [Acidobacteriota bacterium]|nr:NUDIX hydrolase [Acidobacteriota bacterium]